MCQPQQRNQEFLRFLRQVARAHPDGELHLVMENHAAHKRIEIRHWLQANLRIHAHSTSTYASASWINLVDFWFGIIEEQAIHRGTFTFVRDLTTKIRAFIDYRNARSHPFTRTNTTDRILTRSNRETTSNTAH